VRRLLAGLALAAVALVGCSKPATSTPDGMPAGYERINTAFGVRTGGMTSTDGIQTIPAVEFRANGDYAMYAFSTDCYGHFSRGQGVVFAADGTVREQLAEQATSPLTANPQYQPVADKVCAQLRAHIASLPEGEALRKTRFGVVQVEGDAGSQRLTFQGQKVSEDYAFTLERTIALGDTDLVLVNRSSGGNGCPGGQYLFVVVKGGQDAHATDTFGTCQEAKPDIVMNGDSLVVSMPEYGGDGTASFTYRDGQVSLDRDATASAESDTSNAAQTDNSEDQQENAVDAAVAAANSAQEASDPEDASNSTVAASLQRVAGRRQAQWMAMCQPRSQHLTTPAGSQVSLSDEEAQTYCGCLQSSAPDVAAAILRNQDWSGATSGTAANQWQAAQASCIGRLL
jgi:hypothetical protein